MSCNVTASAGVYKQYFLIATVAPIGWGYGVTLHYPPHFADTSVEANQLKWVFKR